MTTAAARETVRIRLWDLPTRLFHWLLAAAVGTAFVTGYLGGNLIQVHGKAGLAVVGLVVFRLVWGFVGGAASRFLHFVPSPARLLDYLKGRWHGLGHNPLGALSVLALLALLATQAGTGLFTNDDISFTGPLQSLVGDDLSLRLTGLHKQLSNLLLAFLGLHLAAIVFHVRFKKDNLVLPMVTGWKEVADLPPEQAAPLARKAGPLALLAALLIAAGAVYAASGALLPAPAPVPAAAPAAAW